MTLSGASDRPVELVRKLDGHRDGQVRELYRWGNEYVEVSTVPNTGGVVDELLRTIAPLVPEDPQAALCARSSPTDEETLAFPADGDANRLSNLPVAGAAGPGSRAAVLDGLRLGVDWRDARAARP